jgi:hypothetical protein
MSMVLGLTAERYSERFWIEKPGEILQRGQNNVTTRTLPYGQITYLLSNHDLIRALAHRRDERGFAPLLQPTEAFLASEFPLLSEGTDTTNYEIAYERRLSGDQFAKLFLFRSDLENYIVSPAVAQTLEPVSHPVRYARIWGIGARYERPLGGYLSGYLRCTYRHFVDREKGDRQIPLNPRWRAILGLNFIDRAGTKIFAEAGWNAAMTLPETGNEPLSERPPARFQINLRLGREPSPRREWSLTINNLFNVPTIYWPGFPAPGRTIRLQYHQRF